jgi:hypothetical protein
MSGPDFPPGVDPDAGRYPAPPPPGLASADAPGSPAGPYAPPQPDGEPDAGAEAYTGNAPAVASLVLGLVGAVLCWLIVVNFILAALAIAFGGFGISLAGARGGAGRGMATAGVLLGVITALMGIVFIVSLYSFILGTCSNGAC